jgi:SAM-dependent methyltransferase
MRETRRRFIVGLIAAVLVLIAGTLITIFTNEELTGAEKTSQAVVWSIVISLLGVIVGGLIELYYQVTKPKPLVEVIEDEKELKQRYEEMRRTRGATCIQAIWSAKYPDEETYFRVEGRDLEERPDLEIERLVNPEVIASKYRDQFLEFIRRHSNLTVWATDVTEFECFVCEYREGEMKRVKALLVLNDTLSRAPHLGIYIDPEKSVALKPLVYAIQSWFMRLPRKQFPGAAREENIWEVNAPAYDLYVTNTEHPFLRKFMEQEQNFLEREISKLASSGDNMSLIEVGSGTARTLFNLMKNRNLLPSLTYLIGIDSSRAMVRIARSKRETLVLPSETAGKFFFLHLSGTRLSQYVLRGCIQLQRVKRDLADNEPIDKIETKLFDKSKKVICCLLNTLGVMGPEARIEVIRNMVAAAGPSDLLIFSVFSADAFNKHATELYGTIRPLVGEFSSDAFDHHSYLFKTSNYYSQWFTKEKICSALIDEGCSDIRVEPVDQSGYFIICHPSS